MATLFLGLAVPDSVASLLTPVWDNYVSVINQRIPREKLHVTLVWLGQAEEVEPTILPKLAGPLPQSFVPTVRFTHVGRGRKRDQLWAYGEGAGPVMSLREQLLQRLKSLAWKPPKQSALQRFVPHMTVASLYDQLSHVGVADYPFVTSFSVTEVLLYQSTPSPNGSSVYSIRERIPLT